MRFHRDPRDFDSESATNSLKSPINCTSFRLRIALGGHDFTFTEKRIGGVAIVQDGTPLPDDTLNAALASDAVLLGAVGGNEFNSLPPDKRPEGRLLAIRAALGGFANLRPCFSFKELTVNSPLRPEVIGSADILAFASCWAGFTSASRARGTRKKASATTR